MILKTKTLAALTAIAVSGIFSSHSFADLSGAQLLLQNEVQKLDPTAVLDNPGPNQKFATDAQLAAAALAVTKEPKLKNRLSVRAAVVASFNLSATNPQYKYASTVILQKVAAGVASNPILLAQAVQGAYSGFNFSVSSDDNSVSADLVGTALLGIRDSGIVRANKIDAAIKTIVVTAIRGSSAITVGTTVGAAAQYSSVNTLARFSTIITLAVSRAANNYVAIAQAVAAAASQIFSPSELASVNINSMITNAVVAGYGANFTATHNGRRFKGDNKLAITNTTSAAVTQGFQDMTGTGAAGLANYTFANLQGGPVTDIYGL